jgi:cytidine deaminase
MDIIDTLFVKRFCLPFDTDIPSYEAGNQQISSCLCGHYNHAACILKGKIRGDRQANILSFGFNMVGDMAGYEPGIHAEHDAINHLRPLTRKKHLQNVNILVIRLSKKNKIQHSKPCANCIENMRILPEKKGYRIKHIYYSNYEGVIVKSSLHQLENEELHYSRFFRKNKYKQMQSNGNWMKNNKFI